MERFSADCERLLTRRSVLRLMGTGVIGLGLTVATPIAAFADPSEDEAQTEAVASSATEIALEDALHRYEEAKAQLDTITTELEAMAVQIDETEHKMAEIQANIRETKRHIAAKQEELEEAKEILAGRVASAYKAGNSSMLDVVLGSSSMEEFVSGVYYLDKVSEGDRASIDEVEELKEVLERQQASLEDRQSRLNELKGRQEFQKQELEAKHQEAQTLLDTLDAEVKELIERRQEEVLAEAEALKQLSSLSASDINDEAAELRANVINASLELLGVPYVFGGTYPTSGGTDCSGLVQWSFAQCGVSIPRTTYTQAAACRAVGNYFTDASLLLPGDLVFCNNGGHVALYLGDGRCIHEPMPGDVCSIVPISRWMSSGFIVGYGFPLPSSTGRTSAAPTE